MNFFCTYCDQGYAGRLVCLYESLVAQREAFRLFVLCFDPVVQAVVETIDRADLVAIPLSELLDHDVPYAQVRTTRSPVEFYFTTTPVLIRYCLQREPTASSFTYLDSDLFFFGPASAVFAGQQGASVGIVPHRFSPVLADRIRFGIYNVAWVSFKRDPDGLACLDWWRERCLEWCHDYVDQGRFADQGYLDDFPRRFNGVRALDHPGVNAAPWNIGGVEVTTVDDRVLLDGKPLLFYHFQGIREYSPGWFEPGLRQYQAGLSRGLREKIYRPYLQHLFAVQGRLQKMHGIAPQFLHCRLNQGDSLRDRWERFKARRVLPYWGRLDGRLINAAASSPTSLKSGPV